MHNNSSRWKANGNIYYKVLYRFGIRISFPIFIVGIAILYRSGLFFSNELHLHNNHDNIHVAERMKNDSKEQKK